MLGTRPNRAHTIASCLRCGAEFYATLNAIKRGKGKYCSQVCAAHAPKPGRDQGGAKNSNWQGGISANKYRYKLNQKRRNPTHVRARELVQAAIFRGELKCTPCVVCGTEDDLQAHHPDYDKPLEVVWFCGTHHRQLHGKKR